MPLYEYQCPQCGRFELIRKFSDPPLEVCPTCGGEVHKLLSAPAIQFKGAGWYITDYARKGTDGGGEKKSTGKEGAGSDGASKEGGGKDSSAKTDGSTATSSGKDTSSKPA